MDYNILVNVKIKSAIQTNYEFKQQDYGQKLIVMAEDYDINGTTARLFINKNDGTVNERIMTKENNNYTYTLDAEDTSCAGKTVSDVKYYKNGVRDSSASFIFNIIPDRFGNLIESKTMSDSLQSALDRVDKTKEIVDEYDEKIEQINKASGRAENAATNSVIAVANCEQATNKANIATDRANTAAATAEGIAENKTGLNDNAIGASTTWSSNKINTSLANQIGTANGASINLPNSFNGGLLLKELQGKSVQNGTPTPDVKVDIVSVGDNGNVTVKTCGKNLFPMASGQMLNNGITLTVSSDGTVTLNGTSSATAIFWIPTRGLSVNSGKYTFSGNNPVSNSQIYLRLRVGETGDTLGNFNGALDTVNAKFTVDNSLSANVMSAGIKVGAGVTLTNFTLKPQLELGSTSTTYEPYKEQLVTIPFTQPLRSVGSVYDRVIKKDGIWGVERKFITKVINGSEPGWYVAETLTNTLRFATDALTGGIITNEVNKLCNRFKTTLYNDISDTEHIRNGGAGYNDALILYINKSRLATPNAIGFTTWLASNPLTVQYQLATPTFEPFSQSIQDQLNKLQTYQGVTNVFTTDALQPTLSVNYGKTDSSALALYAENVSDSKIDKSKSVNNLITTVEGTVLDGRQGKALNEKIGNLSDLKTTSKTDLVGAVNEVNNNLLNKNKFNSANYSYVYLIGACRTSGKCECVFSFPLTYSTKPTVIVTRSLGFYDRTYGNVPVTIAVTEVGSVIFEVTHSSYVAGSLYSIGAWFSVDGTIV